MSKEVDSFGIDLDRFAKTIGVRLEDAVRKLAIDAYAQVTQRTPVDTGRARASWRLATGAPDTSVEEEGKGSYPVQRPSLPKTGGAPFTVYFITNNLPYVKALEDGHSQQAPLGMVAVTITSLKNAMYEAIK